MTTRTQTLAAAIVQRHRPIGERRYPDGTVYQRAHCSDDGLKIWPCEEYRLAMLVLTPEPAPVGQIAMAL